MVITVHLTSLQENQVLHVYLRRCIVLLLTMEVLWQASISEHLKCFKNSILTELCLEYVNTPTASQRCLGALRSIVAWKREKKPIWYSPGRSNAPTYNTPYNVNCSNSENGGKDGDLEVDCMLYVGVALCGFSYQLSVRQLWSRHSSPLMKYWYVNTRRSHWDYRYGETVFVTFRHAFFSRVSLRYTSRLNILSNSSDLITVPRVSQH